MLLKSPIMNSHFCFFRNLEISFINFFLSQSIVHNVFCNKTTIFSSFFLSSGILFMFNIFSKIAFVFFDLHFFLNHANISLLFSIHMYLLYLINVCILQYHAHKSIIDIFFISLIELIKLISSFINF